MTDRPNPWLEPRRDDPAVLVVDDNLVVVKLVMQTLSTNHIRCHWARSMEEAQQILSAFKVDLVIADIRPPSTDGIALAQWIRQEPRLSMLPILFFTAQNDRETIRAAARIPGIDYVLKPLRPKVFRDRVLKMIGESNEFA